jgi:hypothetical protein
VISISLNPLCFWGQSVKGLSPFLKDCQKAAYNQVGAYNNLPFLDPPIAFDSQKKSLIFIAVKFYFFKKTIELQKVI